MAPAALIAFLITTNAVDMLFMDDWPIVAGTLLRAGSGQLGLEDLIRQHNESRPLFPRLFFLAIGTLAEGDTRWLLPRTFILACLVSYSVFFLARATMKARPSCVWGVTFLANLLIFTPKQAQTWLWKSFVGLEPIACLAASVALFHTSLGPRRKVAISAALCTVATFSYANGLSTWVLVAPVLVLAVGPRWLGWWTLGLLLNAGFYFRGYVHPSGHPSPLDALEPVRLGHYVLAFLGASLGQNRLTIATGVGAVFVALFVLVGAYLVVHARDGELWRRMTPWLSIGCYAMLSGLAAGVGRLPYGVRQALAPRYIPFSLYLGLALLFLVPISLWHARASGLLRPGQARVLKIFFAGSLALGLALHANAALMGAGEMIRAGRMLRYGKTCLLFVNVHPDEACLASWAHPNARVLRAYANGLDRLGYLHPGLVESRRLQGIRAVEPGVRHVGVFEGFQTRPGRALFVAAGWAGLPTRAGPADAVVLAGQEPNGDWVPLGFAPVSSSRPDVARERGAAYRNSGWRGALLKRDLRRRPVEISAWAFDAQRGWAVPLEGVHTAEAGRRARPRP